MSDADSRSKADIHADYVNRKRDIARRMQADENQLEIIRDVLPELGPDQQRDLGRRIDHAVEEAVMEFLVGTGYSETAPEAEQNGGENVE